MMVFVVVWAIGMLALMVIAGLCIWRDDHKQYRRRVNNIKQHLAEQIERDYRCVVLGEKLPPCDPPLHIMASWEDRAQKQARKELGVS